MYKLLKIEKDNSVVISNQIAEFLNPDYVYIPMPKDYALLVKQNDYVFKDAEIMKNNESFIKSTVSGYVRGKQVKKNCFNNSYDCLVIENDFREKVQKRYGAKKFLNNISLKEIKNKLAVLGFSLDGCDSIVLSVIDDEPYVFNNAIIYEKYISEIFELLDALSNVLNIKNVYLIIKNINGLLIEKSMDYLGTYPNFHLKLVSDVYPIGNKEVLKRIFFKKNNPFIINTKEAYNIYKYLKKNTISSEKYITVAGDYVANPAVIKVKIGSSVAEIIKLFNIDFDNVICAFNGLMAGKAIETENVIVTNKLESIIFASKNIDEPSKCINCGLCREMCPMGLNPRNLTDYQKNKCINCGACSYICPSKINILEKIKEGKNE